MEQLLGLHNLVFLLISEKIVKIVEADDNGCQQWINPKKRFESAINVRRTASWVGLRSPSLAYPPWLGMAKP